MNFRKRTLQISKTTEAKFGPTPELGFLKFEAKFGATKFHNPLNIKNKLRQKLRFFEATFGAEKTINPFILNNL
jgi:hypothetical protein